MNSYRISLYQQNIYFSSWRFEIVFNRKYKWSNARRSQKSVANPNLENRISRKMYRPINCWECLYFNRKSYWILSLSYPPLTISRCRGGKSDSFIHVITPPPLHSHVKSLGNFANCSNVYANLISPSFSSVIYLQFPPTPYPPCSRAG